ncbi:hypothetical protein PS847_00518 [Pseudomonas fluorescens]|uniref:DUF637 domain-containing protein n=1 Tax=Pseudomonas fluorescens TaxID=294 RepID=A0A5E7GVP9_PSEFL|nr:DUF637 domain-containing protein [Pseudomonas fluorescens]VVO55640.1 hypothetical protein PS847_00518 [Pseudomonas fluorescens]
MSSAGDEYNVETHSKDGKKRVHEQDDHTVQKAAEFIAGGDVKTSSGRDTTLVASKISAGNEAYVYAGNDLNLLAAQNKDHTLYDMKEKGGFGNLKLQPDEVTQVTHVGSEIKTGGNLSLVSLGDQHYQVAKLDSGKDILLDSGGAITFEGVKDLHDESHTKTNNNAAWVSAKGRGNTDETLRQTQMIAKGNIVLKAVDGLKIDIKDVSQESVSQTIDAMVKADPQLAWLKEAELRGDVDWRRVEEIHKSFKYSTSGLGVAAQLALAILLAAVTGGAGAGLIGATAGTFSAGFANAVLIAVETTAANSAISNKGDLGSVLKDVFSSENLQGYVLSGMLGGIGNGLGYNPTELGFDWSSAGQVILKTSADTLAQTALQGGSLGDNFVNNLLGAVIDIGGAIAANKVGNLNLVEGSPTKIAAHALVGGLKSMALGGDFKTGALAGGANEALVQYLADLILPENYDPNMPGADQAKANLLAMSQLIAVLSAVIADTDPNIAANIAATATQYNYLSHSDLERAAHDLSACGNDAACANTKYAEYHALSQKQDIEAVAQCAANSGSCEGLSRIVAEAEAKTQKLKDLAASASPEAAKMFDLLIAENHGFQNMLAGITAGNSVAAIADTLVQTLGISHEMAMAAVEGLAMSVSGMAPTIKTAGGGKNKPKGGPAGSTEEAESTAPKGNAGNTKSDSAENVTYFRVEGGGTGFKTSQNRITANDDGSITINPGCTGQLCVSVGNADHATYYLTNKRPDGSVVVFDIDAKTHKEIMDRVIPQHGDGPRDRDAPKRVDEGQPGYSLELPKIWESLLENSASNARVYTQDEFLKEFKK